jgi:hypothetical protein
MKNKITRYTIIERPNIKDLENTVEAYILRGGWEPKGGAKVNLRDSIKDKTYIQTMIFRETK